MIIIIEGPDGTGKSTLATQISKQTGYKIVHRRKTTDTEDKKKLMADYLGYIERRENVIFDRCWYSEFVYGGIFNDDQVISLEEIDEIESKLEKSGALIIFCTGKLDEIWSRCLERGEDYVTDRNDFMRIFITYEHLFYILPHKIPVLTYKVS